MTLPETDTQVLLEESEQNAINFERARIAARLAAKGYIIYGSSIEVSVWEAVGHYSHELRLTREQSEILARETMAEVFGKSREQIQEEYDEESSARMAESLRIWKEEREKING